MTPVGCAPGELVTREENGDVHIQTPGAKYGFDVVCTIAVEEFSCRDPINDAIFCACFQSLDNGWCGERPEVLSIWDTVQEANAQVEARGTEVIEDQASMHTDESHDIIVYRQPHAVDRLFGEMTKKAFGQCGPMEPDEEGYYIAHAKLYDTDGLLTFKVFYHMGGGDVGPDVSGILFWSERHPVVRAPQEETKKRKHINSNHDPTAALTDLERENSRLRAEVLSVPSTAYKVGTQCEFMFKNKWFPGSIVRTDGSKADFRYASSRHVTSLDLEEDGDFLRLVNPDDSLVQEGGRSDVTSALQRVEEENAKLHAILSMVDVIDAETGKTEVAVMPAANALDRQRNAEAAGAFRVRQLTKLMDVKREDADEFATSVFNPVEVQRQRLSMESSDAFKALIAAGEAGLVPLKQMGHITEDELRERLPGCPSRKLSRTLARLHTLVEDETFHPYRVKHPGNDAPAQVEPNGDDPRFVEIEAQLGAGVSKLLVDKIVELDQYCSARYYTVVPWHEAENRPLTLSEGIFMLMSRKEKDGP